jgi:hypothetical protein
VRRLAYVGKPGGRWAQCCKKLSRHPWRNKIFRIWAGFLFRIRYSVCTVLLALFHAAFLLVFYRHFFGVHLSAFSKTTLGEPFLYKSLLSLVVYQPNDFSDQKFWIFPFLAMAGEPPNRPGLTCKIFWFTVFLLDVLS